MKIRSVVALVGLAISFALPTFAQQKDTVDPQLRQVADALSKKFDEAYNNNDLAALLALYTEDGIEVTNTGPVYGREAIGKWKADVFKKFRFSNVLTTIDQNSPHSIGTAGNEMWQTGEWTQTLQGQTGGPIQIKGYFSSIAVREGDAWKLRMIT
jgi:ketosteroid isomerase-like protein